MVLVFLVLVFFVLVLVLEPIGSSVVAFPVGSGPSVERVKLGRVGNGVVVNSPSVLLGTSVALVEMSDEDEEPVIGLFSVSDAVLSLLGSDDGNADSVVLMYTVLLSVIGVETSSVKLVTIEELGVGTTSVVLVGVYVDSSGASELDDEVGDTSVVAVSVLDELGVGKISVMIVGVYVDSCGPSELDDEVGKIYVVVVSSTDV